LDQRKKKRKDIQKYNKADRSLLKRYLMIVGSLQGGKKKRKKKGIEKDKKARGPKTRLEKPGRNLQTQKGARGNVRNKGTARELHVLERVSGHDQKKRNSEVKITQRV